MKPLFKNGNWILLSGLPVIIGSAYYYLISATYSKESIGNSIALIAIYIIMSVMSVIKLKNLIYWMLPIGIILLGAATFFVKQL
jgi:hypothetical protein